MTMLRLQCKAQNYGWGRKGSACSVGRLYALGSDKSADESLPYAELWMGTHPSGPSYVTIDSSDSLSKELKDWLTDHPQALGAKVLARWNGELPFLFKVLSVATALSIQAHPDKKLAERLHALHPENYKDDNHKPEMALAVTDFEALCGFVSTQELQECVRSIPELADLLGSEAVAGISSLAADADPTETKAALKDAFTKLMTADTGLVAEALSQLIARLESERESRLLSKKEELILRLNEQYPSDVGVLSAYFLNYLQLSPGEAIYLAANEPHAYLAGECVECMAASDNVVRAGLTPKFRDTDILCSMLTYVQGKPEILRGDRLDPHTLRYSPPFDEFEVDSIVVPSGQTYKLPVSKGPAILLAFKGAGSLKLCYGGEESLGALKAGQVLFLPSDASLEVTTESSEDLQLFRAGVNSRVLAD